MNYKSFETERLILKPASVDDAAFILKILNMPKFLKFVGDRKVRTLEQAKNYIAERMLPQLEKLGYGNYIVIQKSDNTKAGCCGLYKRDGLDIVDIGFAYLPEYEGKGFGFEAANALKKAAKNDFNIKEICAITAQQNKASQKLLEKLGLQFQKMVVLPNETEELRYYYLQL